MPKKAKARAVDLLKKLQAGADFTKMAKQYSDDPTGKDNGGDLGTCLFATSPHGNNPCLGGPLGWSSYPYTVSKFGYAADPASDAECHFSFQR